jgi:hypothetical protein
VPTRNLDLDNGRRATQLPTITWGLDNGHHATQFLSMAVMPDS